MDAKRNEISLFIRQCGLRVNTTVMVISHSITLFRKVFKTSASSDYDYHTVGLACLYLAGKVCEESVRLRDLINVGYKILFPLRDPLELDDVYWKLRESVTCMELHILRILKYEMDVDLPHNYLLYFSKSLYSWLPPVIVSRVPIIRTAWTLLQDSYNVTNICLEYQPHHIAVGLLYASLQIHGIHVPLNESSKVEWWASYCDDITINDIKTIIAKVFTGYNYENKLTNNPNT